MSASFFLGTNTGAPSATHTHRNACVLPMEEEEKDGKGARLRNEAGEKGNKMLPGNGKDTENH